LASEWHLPFRSVITAPQNFDEALLIVLQALSLLGGLRIMKTATLP
jgi:hypothetical protein